jgi:hypothetical protein
MRFFLLKDEGVARHRVRARGSRVVFPGEIPKQLARRKLEKSPEGWSLACCEIGTMDSRTTIWRVFYNQKLSGFRANSCRRVLVPVSVESNLHPSGTSRTNSRHCNAFPPGIVLLTIADFAFTLVVMHSQNWRLRHGPL